MASQRSEANSVATSALLQEQNPGVAPGQYTRASLNVGYTTMGKKYPGSVNNQLPLGVGGVLGLTEISARMQRLLATENPVRHGPLSSLLQTREHGWPMVLILSLYNIHSSYFLDTARITMVLLQQPPPPQKSRISTHILQKSKLYMPTFPAARHLPNLTRKKYGI